MASFAALAEARRKHLQDLVTPFTIPVLRLLEDGAPDYWCTGALLRLGSEAVLIGASHALASEAPALQLASGAIAVLHNPVVHGKELLPYSDPLTDVACARV